MTKSTKTAETAKKGRPRKSETVRSHKAAAKLLSVTVRTLQNWRAEGCPGFEGDGTVDLARVRPWAEKRLADRTGTLTSKEEKLLEEIRKLRLANDEKEKRLISREWMAERIHIAAGKVDGFRQRSEAQHPLLFAAANGDVAQCREVIRKIWDEITASMNSLAADFSEDGAKGPHA